MERNVYTVLTELHDYIADPKKAVLNTTDRAHLEATLRTLLHIYAENPSEAPSKDLEPARRPPMRSQEKHKPWFERFLG